MAEHYGFSPELRRLAGGNAHFPAADSGILVPLHQHNSSHQALLGSLGGTFGPAPPPTLTRGVDAFGLPEDGGGGCSGRWPRQETLTLLEVRSRLDSLFREAVQKAPLWEQVSRIMAEEHGYHRSGKKCKEKLENLYKYYKKTKEGKAGRHDGKHYRFFRQLEALYGENTNFIPDPGVAANRPCFEIDNTSNVRANQEPFQPHRVFNGLSFSNSTDFNSSSSSEDDEDGENLSTTTAFQASRTISKSVNKSRKSWGVKIREFVDSQLRTFMESQEAWFENMLKALENMEQERISREEAWRKQEAVRLDQEHRARAEERAWMEARDAALIEALARISRRLSKPQSFEELACSGFCRKYDYHFGSEGTSEDNSVTTGWPVAEISSLTNLRISMQSKFERCHEFSEEAFSLWSEISAAMACLGYTRSAQSCKEKWECMNKYFRGVEQDKKHNHYQHLDFLYKHGHHSDSQEGDDDLPFRNNDLQCSERTSTGAKFQMHAGLMRQSNCF